MKMNDFHIRLVDDVIWFMPLAFIHGLGKANGLDLHEPLPLPPNAQFETRDLVKWASSLRSDPVKYARALSTIAHFNTIFLNPILAYYVYENARRSDRSRIEDMLARFDMETSFNVHMLPCRKQDFETFSLEELNRLSIQYHQIAAGLGGQIIACYEAGNSCLLDINSVIQWYTLLVNFNAYCWRLSQNEELTSLTESELRKDEPVKLLLDFSFEAKEPLSCLSKPSQSSSFWKAMWTRMQSVRARVGTAWTCLTSRRGM